MKTTKIKSADGSSKSYHHINQYERDRIQRLLDEGADEAAVARVLGRDKSTIGREIERNRRTRGKITAVNKQQYEAGTAGHKAYAKRLYAKHKGKKIESNRDLRQYIIRGLKKNWGPDEISGSMKVEQQPFYASKTTIYEWLYSEWGQAYTKYLYTKRHKPKPRKLKTEKVMIPDRTGIEQRPETVNDRSEYGHHEADTIVSGKSSGGRAALAVDVERKSRLVSARKTPNLKPKTFSGAMRKIKNKFTCMKSVTYDNGIENKDHASLEVEDYFCDPYSSWQKGGVENANRMIRRYIPKGTNLDNISPQKLAYVVRIINNKPRKILGYKSALQIAKEEALLK
jgi:transposase, IS30 family